MQSPYSDYLEGIGDVTGTPLGSDVSPLIWKLDWRFFIILNFSLAWFHILCINWDLIFSYNTISNPRISNSHTTQPRWIKSLQKTTNKKNTRLTSVFNMRFHYQDPNFIHFEIRLYSNSTCNTLFAIWIAADSRSVWIVASLYNGLSVLWS